QPFDVDAEVARAPLRTGLGAQPSARPRSRRVSAACPAGSHGGMLTPTRHAQVGHSSPSYPSGHSAGDRLPTIDGGTAPASRLFIGALLPDRRRMLWRTTRHARWRRLSMRS